MVGEDLRKFSDLPIKVRNKPRPNNEWWGKDIKEDLKDHSVSDEDIRNKMKELDEKAKSDFI